MTMPCKTVTQAEMCALLKISTDTFGDLLKTRRIPVVRIGPKTLRFVAADVVRALTEPANPNQEAPADA